MLVIGLESRLMEMSVGVRGPVVPVLMLVFHVGMVVSGVRVFMVHVPMVVLMGVGLFVGGLFTHWSFLALAAGRPAPLLIDWLTAAGTGGSVDWPDTPDERCSILLHFCALRDLADDAGFVP